MTAAEERMCGAFPRGQDVDVRGPADEDPARGVDWGADWGPSGPYGRPWCGPCCFRMRSPVRS